MKKLGLVLMSAVLGAPALGVAQDNATRIAAAVIAAPEAMRAGATVVAGDEQGNTVTLREGTNELVCLADDPSDARFSVACYHKDLEPYMARGRKLKAEGVVDHVEQRWQEMEAGDLESTDHPATLWVLAGSGFNAESGEVEGAYLRSVIYHPYATSASTGLPTERMPEGLPWLMFEGSVGAHIMISPPRNR